jgi:hypothetical protein
MHVVPSALDGCMGGNGVGDQDALLGLVQTKRMRSHGWAHRTQADCLNQRARLLASAGAPSQDADCEARFVGPQSIKTQGKTDPKPNIRNIIGRCG